MTSTPDTPPTSPPTPPLPASAVCRSCAYSLKGLPEHGACPECGGAYTPESVRHITPLPDAFTICLRLGWPLAGFALSALGIPLVGLVAVDDYGLTVLLLLLGLLMIPALLINTPLQVLFMSRHHIHPADRSRNPLANLHKLGPLAVTLFLSCIVGPFILFGACLMIVAAL